MDGEWLHSVCNTSEIRYGDKIKLPWSRTANKGKVVKVQYLNAVVVDNTGGWLCTTQDAVAADNIKTAKSSSKS